MQQQPLRDQVQDLVQDIGADMPFAARSKEEREREKARRFWGKEKHAIARLRAKKRARGKAVPSHGQEQILAHGVPGTSGLETATSDVPDAGNHGDTFHNYEATDEPLTVTSRKRAKRTTCLPVLTNHPSSPEAGTSKKSQRGGMYWSKVHCNS